MKKKDFFKLALWTVLLVLSFSACDESDNVGSGDVKDTTDNVNGGHSKYNLTTDEILSIVNGHRKNGAVCGSNEKQPVGTLKWNDKLAKAALDHANDMYKNNYFDHVGLNGSHFTERAKAVGYTGAALNENIAQGSVSEKDVMNLWMLSDGHCRNIMSEKATEIGIARSDKNNYWVMLLGF